MSLLTLAKRFGPGESIHPSQAHPGDFVLTHRDALSSKLIALGQRRRFRGADRGFAHWSHIAGVETGSGGLVEALTSGVVRSPIEKYRDVEYHYVHVSHSDADRAQMARFLAACVGREYGWGEIASLGLALLSGGDHLGFGNPGTLVCSGLIGQMLCRGDAIFDRDPNRLMPADIAQWADVKP